MMIASHWEYFSYRLWMKDLVEIEWKLYMKICARIIFLFRFYWAMFGVGSHIKLQDLLKIYFTIFYWSFIFLVCCLFDANFNNNEKDVKNLIKSLGRIKCLCFCYCNIEVKLKSKIKMFSMSYRSSFCFNDNGDATTQKVHWTIAK